MKHSEPLTRDLRKLVEQHLGKPLAASAYAGLWRCPVCPPERQALLMVSANEHRCLSGYSCDGGATEWIHDTTQSVDELFVLGESA